MSGQPVYDEASILDLDQSSKLCTQCRAIFSVGPRPESAPEPAATEYDRIHGERDFVRAVFDVGCVVCRHLFNSAPAHDEFLARVRAEWNDVGPENLALISWTTWLEDDSCGPGTGKDKRFFRVGLSDVLQSPENKEQWHNYEHFTVTKLNAPTSFTFSPRPDPAQLPRLIRQWTAKCQTHEAHAQCRTYRAVRRQAPRRVLEITEKALLLRVLPRDNWTGAYVTLSHRWTIPEPPKLRRTNEAELRSAGISIVSLPQTFQDAVQVARWLDVRYLWIDSLCIFQDSVEDWEREAGSMGAIYGGSLFNVAAIDADGVSQTGFLARPAGPGAETSLPVVCSRDNAREDEIVSGDGSLEGNVVHSHGAFEHQVLHSMLLGRGWVHQEVLLAPATLFVSRKQAWWHCIGGTSSEAYPDGIPPFLSVPGTSKLRSFLVKARKKAAVAAANSGSNKTEDDTGSSNPEPCRIQILVLWFKVVGMYSGADFTYAPDRLVALAGVADALADILGGYYCGMWYKPSPVRGGPGDGCEDAQRDDFPSQLMWVHAPRMSLRREALAFEDTKQQQSAIDGSHNGESPTKTPIIPTWSWASSPREIRYFPRENRTRTLTHLASRPPFERLNPFGWPMDHAAATLHLLGVLLPFCILPSTPNTSLSVYPRISDDDRDFVYLYFDYRQELDEAEEMAARLKFAHPIPGFYFLPLYYSEKRELCIEGLVLRERSDHQLLGCPAGRRLFSRVGRFQQVLRRPGEEREWRVEDMPEDWPPIFEDFEIARYRDAGLDKADLCEDRELGDTHRELDEIYLI